MTASEQHNLRLEWLLLHLHCGARRPHQKCRLGSKHGCAADAPELSAPEEVSPFQYLASTRLARCTEAKPIRLRSTRVHSDPLEDSVEMTERQR